VIRTKSSRMQTIWPSNLRPAASMFLRAKTRPTKQPCWWGWDYCSR